MIVIITSLVLGVFLSTSILAAQADTTAPPWDFEDHTYNHVNLATLTSSQIVNQLTTMNSVFQAHGLPPPLHLAYPSGYYNEQVINIVSQYRLSGRTAGGGNYFPEPYPVPEWYTLSCACMQADMSFNDIKGWIDNAVSHKGLLNLFTHEVSNPPITYGTTPAILGQVLDYLLAQQNTGNLMVLTLRQAYTAFNGQKAVVVISFDDGWVTDYTAAWPLFKAHGFAGTSFIVGTSPTSGNPDAMTWAMIEEMAQVSAPPPSNWSVSISANSSSGGNTNPSGLVNVPSGGLTVTATPASGYSFSYWLFDGANLTSNPVTLPAQSPGSGHTLTAYFAATPPPPVGWLVSISVNGSAGGTTSPSGLQNVTSGALNVTAYPAANYSFSNWLFDGNSLPANPVNLPAQTVGTNHTLIAFFSRVSGWLVSISVNGSLGGTTNPTGLVNVTSGSLVVTGSPSANYVFRYWLFDGNNMTVNPVTLPSQTAGTNHTLFAFFAGVRHLVG